MSTLVARAVAASVDSEVLLAPVSLSVGAGEAVIVRGPNGSGKTTLLRILSGVLRPTSGEVSVDGHTLDDRRRAMRHAISARIGLPAFARELTAREHLRFIATTWGESGQTATDTADETMAALGIDHLSQRFVHELSSGQLQLLSLATALVRPFSVLVLDEPEQRLDEHRLAVVAAVLRTKIAAGAAVVVATHSADLVEALPGTTVTLGDR